MICIVMSNPDVLKIIAANRIRHASGQGTDIVIRSDTSRVSISELLARRKQTYNDLLVEWGINTLSVNLIYDELNNANIEPFPIVPVPADFAFSKYEVNTFTTGPSDWPDVSGSNTMFFSGGEASNTILSPNGGSYGVVKLSGSVGDEVATLYLDDPAFIAGTFALHVVCTANTAIAEPNCIINVTQLLTVTGSNNSFETLLSNGAKLTTSWASQAMFSYIINFNGSGNPTVCVNGTKTSISTSPTYPISSPLTFSFGWKSDVGHTNINLVEITVFNQTLSQDQINAVYYEVRDRYGLP
jgi:hypothetical protein